MNARVMVAFFKYAAYIRLFLYTFFFITYKFVVTIYPPGAIPERSFFFYNVLENNKS